MALSFKDLLPKKKPKAKGLFIPEFLKKSRTGADVADDRTNRANEDLEDIRYGQTTAEIIRNYLKNSPDVSHASESIMRFIITDSYTIVAKGLEDDIIDPEATKLTQMFAARLDRLPIRYDGFSPQSSMNANSESLVNQMLTNGNCCAELVLDKSLLPSHIQPISTNELKYRSGGDRAIPYIKQTSGDIVLDTPAVYIASLSQDPTTPYAESWFKSAVQTIIASTKFTNDLKRAFNKASLPRVAASIDTEKFMKSLPPEILYDSKKLKEAFNNIINQIQAELNDLSPEDALVNFDMVEVDHLTAGNASNHENVDTHAKILNGQLSNGLHVLPSLLGRGESQTTASTEAVLFLKIVESLQGRLNEIYSYLFTLAARLHGYDVTVKFTYKKPSLRPEIEEESFLAVRQSRILEQLSLGLISDEEASIKLTGDLPSGEFTPLSGTGFHNGAHPAAENPYSNTSVSGEGVNNTKEQKDRQQGNNKPKSNKTSGR